MNPDVTLSVPATIDGVREAILAFDEFGRAHGVIPGTGWRVRLALDEILSNIVYHGVGDGTAATGGPIEVRFSLDRRIVTVEIIDPTAPFNPLLAQPPDTASALGERRPGGLGIMLTRNLMDDAVYERRGHRNYLLMKCGPHADR